MADNALPCKGDWDEELVTIQRAFLHWKVPEGSRHATFQGGVQWREFFFSLFQFRFPQC